MTRRFINSPGRLPIYVTQATFLIFAFAPFALWLIWHALTFRAEQIGCSWPKYSEAFEPQYIDVKDALYSRLWNVMLFKIFPLTNWSLLFVPSYFWALRGLCSKKFRWMVVGVHFAGWLLLWFDLTQKFVCWFMD